MLQIIIVSSFFRRKYAQMRGPLHAGMVGPTRTPMLQCLASLSIKSVVAPFVSTVSYKLTSLGQRVVMYHHSTSTACVQKLRAKKY